MSVSQASHSPVNPQKVFLSPLNNGFDLMKNFFKLMDQNRIGFVL
jgi:hypothetical protein